MSMTKMHDSAHEPLLSQDVDAEKSNKKKLGCFFVSLAKWVLQLTMCVVFVAWIALFFVTPSDFGSNFYNDLVAATAGTLFGETGIAMLLYSGPIIIIAFLAVPYLIISDEEQEGQQLHDKRVPRLRLSTFPFMVDGPFGIVSAAEMIGILLFIVFVLWAVYAYTVTNFAMLPSYGDLTLQQKRVQMLQMSAYCFGLIALSCLALLFLPVTRGSILLRLIDIPFEHAAKYHVWLGNLTMFLLTLHGLGYMIVWMIRGTLLSSIVEWKNVGGANFAGIISYIFGLLIWFTALSPVRKRNFELFFYTHQLYLFFVIFFALHVGDIVFSKAAGGIFLFMLDRFLRFCQSRRTANIVSAVSFPCGSVKLVLSKPENLQYNALSFIFVQVQEVSWLQWHPFSVSSSPFEDENHVSILIKAVGDWTSNLREKVLDSFFRESQIEPPIHLPSKINASVEGPYGHESPYYLEYSKLILVAGGSGISPFLAILNDILHKFKNGKPCQLRNILMVWAVRSSIEASLLSTVDMESTYSFYSDKLSIEVQIYVTHESEPSLEEGKVPRAISSSVFSREYRMSGLIGTRTKIWPGIYVTLSTIGFIIILFFLDKYYINPFNVSNWWYRGLLFFACMVVSVFVFGGLVAVFWHSSERNPPKEAADENGKGIDIVKHEAVDLCWDTLAGFSTIRYGCRPNFKEIFGWISERWEFTNIGVIVCGPPTLQSSVAKECRSRNLTRSENHPVFHFHSHSFAL